MRRAIAGLTAAVAAVFLMASDCESEPDAQKEERDRQQGNYEERTEAQPAEQMDYSPTRETINFWINTWDEPGKLSYVYLQNANGDMIGYYVLKGLPVSYCASLTPTYRIEDWYSGDPVVPAPAMDAVYYFGGGSCETYYGEDATTGAYIEYTAGMGINVLLYDQPLARQDVQPLGQTSIEDVESG